MTSPGFNTAARVIGGSVFVLAGGKLVADTKNGTRLKRDDAVAAMKEHAEWADMEYGWGHYSGNPWMDQKAHWFKRLTLLGPMNLKIKWQEATIRFNSWVNDVLFPNLVPLAVMAAGAVTAIGPKNIKKAGQATSRFFRTHVRVAPGFKSGMSTVTRQAASKTAKGAGTVLSLPFKSPVAFFSAVGALVLGNFALNRFRDSYGHDGQHNYFRDFTNTQGH